MEGKNVARSCFQPDTVTSSVLQVPVPNGRMPKQMPSLWRLRRYPLFLQCSFGALSNQFVVPHKDVCQQCASLLTVVVALSCMVFYMAVSKELAHWLYKLLLSGTLKVSYYHWFSLPMCHCSLGKWLEFNLILPQLWLLFFLLTRQILEVSTTTCQSQSRMNLCQVLLGLGLYWERLHPCHLPVP